MDDTEDRRGDDVGGPSGSDADGSPGNDGNAGRSGRSGGGDGDTFGVGIHVTEAEFQFVVHVPADIDSGWTDPEAFQRLVERTVWDRLDREATLRGIAQEASVGDTVTLGRVTLRPDETVVRTEFRDPAVKP
ncbi:hypothetical protein [Halobellus rarus]|uniref:DUF8124 domain-containing protein n=1 Tax=Halobellus rarus TaxID=1126237 RepID=A0ABD6CS80_9EURY|nr:hypothetical protein [Halobellus rarus]